MRPLILGLIAVGLFAIATPSLEAGCDSCRACPHCKTPCTRTVKDDKETKTCYDVETKTICVPRVLLPWEKCNCGCSCTSKCTCTPPKPGYKKCVNVLVKREYTCPKCKYSWDPSKCGCDGGVGVERDVPEPPAPATAAVRVNGQRSAATAKTENSGRDSAASKVKDYKAFLTGFFTK